VEERVSNPIEEANGREKVILLAQPVQLWISVEHARRDELVKDTDNKGR
jgi:hypothetical protein